MYRKEECLTVWVQKAPSHWKHGIKIILTLKPLKRWIFFIKTLKAKRFFSIGNHHNGLSHSFSIHLNTYVMGLRPVEIVYAYGVEIDFSCQNLTSTEII